MAVWSVGKSISGSFRMIFGTESAEIIALGGRLCWADVLISSMLCGFVTKITIITRVFETKTQKRVKKG